MTKTELEEAIKNGESVWCLYQSHKEIELLHFYKENTYKFEEVNYIGGGTELCLVINYDWYYPLKYLFKTKSEAKHYLHHANITRTEQLPFLTWEEFLEERYFGFYSIYNEWIDVYVTNGLETNKLIITIENATKEEFINNYDLTEENFYKAYDECRKLFLGERK